MHSITRRPTLFHSGAALVVLLGASLTVVHGRSIHQATDGDTPEGLALPGPAKNMSRADASVPTASLIEVSASTRRAEYGFSLVGKELWSATNRSQGLSSRVGRDGLEIRSVETVESGEDASWKLRSRTVSFGRVGCVDPVACISATVEGARAELNHGELAEWFINDVRGIEQGWTITNRPEGSGPLAIGLSLVGDLSLRLDPSRRSGVLVDDKGKARAHYGGLAAWDAGGRDLEVWLVSQPAGCEVRVDDSEASYPITVDPTFATADWTKGSGQLGAWFGRSVSTAGDINGDGYDDLITGAPLHDNGQANEGRAFVYLGSDVGLGTTTVWTAESNQGGAQFGFSVSSAGDVNGDGYSDVIVGAPYYGNGQFDEGRAYVYHGSAAGLNTTAAWTAESNQPASQFGTSVSSAGDVNGDGYSDVIVGAPYYDNGEVNEGRAFVYLGSATGLMTAAAWSVESNQVNALFGTSVSGAGDVNGDGYSDVIVGAPNYDNGEPSEGAAFAYYGSPTGLGTAAAWTGESNQQDALYGDSVSTAGDVNGDGYSDIIVGAFLFDDPESAEGRAYAYHGSASGLGVTPAWTAEPNDDFNYFGSSVSAAGDVNGDGFGDVIVGAYGAGPAFWFNVGQAHVFYGSSAGLSATEGWSAQSFFANSYFGKSVSTAGDVNGDGYSDVVVGAYGYGAGQANGGNASVFHGAAAPSPTQYCTGGTSAAGCSATISGSGVPSTTASTGFNLISIQVEGAKDGLYFFGTGGRQANSWGNGTSLQCVIPPVKRAGLLAGTGTAGLCDGVFSQDLNALWCPTCPNPAKNPGAGAVVQAQLWYRDPLNTSNQTTSLSDAIEFVVGP